MAKYVYSFGNGTADGDGKMKDTLGGKGAGLAEMCRASCRCPPASPFRPTCATFISTTTSTSRPKLTSRCWTPSKKLEGRMGQKLGDTYEPAAGQRALRREVLHAGHDGHHPQPRPERRDGRSRSGQERQPALRLRLLPPLHPDVRRGGARSPRSTISTKSSTARKRRPKPSSIPTSPPRICRQSSPATRSW